MIEYEFSRLAFIKQKIDALAPDDRFRIITPADTFEMTRREFEETFPNVVKSLSYSDRGLYSYSKTPAKALKFVVS